MSVQLEDLAPAFAVPEVPRGNVPQAVSHDDDMDRVLRGDADDSY